MTSAFLCGAEPNGKITFCLQAEAGEGQPRADHRMTSPNAGRPVFAVNAAVSVALVVLVAAVALVVNPPAPPGIAAFAPQASKPITKAPQGQSALNGNGQGACARGQVCTGPSATPTARSAVAAPHPGQSAVPVSSTPTGAPLGVPSALQCFAWPDGSITQTFDAQSPPCIASWPGQARGNGGTTATGVTGTTIRVAFPTSSSSTVKQVQPFLDFVNSHFELYGRKIVLAPFASTQAADTSGYENPSEQKADAEQAASLKPFAAFDFVDQPLPFYAALPAYVDGLARHKVVGILGGLYALLVTDADLQKNAPYSWTYLPTVGDLLVQSAIMSCHQLVGHNASHASSFATKPRKFGLILPLASNYGGPVPRLQDALNILKGCGVDDPPIAYDDSGARVQQGLSNQLLKMKQEGVTTLIYLPTGKLGGGTGTPMSAANSVNFHPEWVLLGANQLVAGNIAAEPTDQTQSSFGILGFNKVLTLSQTPWYQSYLAAGGSPTAATSLNIGGPFYRQLLLLASGVQLAGPNLTADSFSRALTSATFPNPGSGQAPSYQGKVGFPQAGDPMLRDFAGYWPDPSANEATTLKASQSQASEDYQNFCWVLLGGRWADASWPSTDRWRSGGCR